MTPLGSPPPLFLLLRPAGVGGAVAGVGGAGAGAGAGAAGAAKGSAGRACRRWDPWHAGF